MFVIDGPPWCLCAPCETCNSALFANDGTLTCSRDGQSHEYGSSCDAWTRSERGIEMCEAGPCETCDAHQWWGHEAEYWRLRLAQMSRDRWPAEVSRNYYRGG